MTLTCENPAKVTLNYTSIIPNKITYSGKNYDRQWSLGTKPYAGLNDEGASQFFSISSPNPDTEISWKFTPNLDQTHYKYSVKVTHANPTIDPQTVEYYAYFNGGNGNIGFWFTETGLAKWEVENLTPQKTTATVKPGWYKVDSPNAFYKSITDISIGGKTVYEILGYAWNMEIYFNGEYQLTKNVKTSTETPPDDQVFITEATPGTPQTETFYFEFKPQEIKLTKVEGTEYTWKITKVLSEEEEEIFSFSGIDPELLCFAEEGQCPEGTCEVECPDHYCCYNEFGISLFSFSK